MVEISDLIQVHQSTIELSLDLEKLLLNLGLKEKYASMNAKIKHATDAIMEGFQRKYYRQSAIGALEEALRSTNEAKEQFEILLEITKLKKEEYETEVLRQKFSAVVVKLSEFMQKEKEEE